MPPRIRKIAGVRMGANSVFRLDTETERAVSPLAMKVMTLEAVPLGQQPTRIKPAASSGGKASSLATPQATTGIMRYRSATP